jgi:hypothetical protein
LSRKLEMMPLVGFEGEGEQEDHRRSSGAGTRGEEARSGCGGGSAESHRNWELEIVFGEAVTFGCSLLGLEVKIIRWAAILLSFLTALLDLT